MTRRIALNGLGRIGKLVLRDLIDSGAGGEIVLLNDPVGDVAQHALLMELDSVHARFARIVRNACCICLGQLFAPCCLTACRLAEMRRRREEALLRETSHV